jgi:hypothetical protein
MERVHAEERAGELLRHVPVHPVDDRPGADETGDTDEHTEEGEAAL